MERDHDCGPEEPKASIMTDASLPPISLPPLSLTNSSNDEASSVLSSRDSFQGRIDLGRYSRFTFASDQTTRQDSFCSTDECSAVDFEIPSPSLLPTPEEFEAAGNVPVFDEYGNSRRFKSFYAGPSAIGEQQLIIFVRHFFCKVSLTPMSPP
jgi:hypothetical protein